jgi:hypothetical protein
MRIPVPELLHFIATVAQIWLALSVVAAIAWCALVTSYKRRAWNAASPVQHPPLTQDQLDETWLLAWPADSDDEIDARFERILTAEGLR